MNGSIMLMCPFPAIRKMIENPLNWDDCYAIALALIEVHGALTLQKSPWI